MRNLLLVIVAICFALVIFFIKKLEVELPTFKLCQPDYEEFIHERLADSEIIFVKAKEARHLAAKETPIPDDNPWSPKDFRNMWDYMYPNYNCPHIVERIGRVGDGGKWICGLMHISKRANPCIVYSYGISDDTSFEQEILNRTNCVIRGYDHTVRPEHIKPVVYKEPRFTFSPFGIGTENTEQLRTLKSEMQRNGDNFIDILKMDVERAEFAVMEQIIKDFPSGLPFGQLIIELHVDKLSTHHNFKRLMDWWEKLESAGLRAFRSEPNVFPGLLGYGAEPNFLEFSFMNVNVDNVLLHG